jgi:hypothetical protein
MFEFEYDLDHCHPYYCIIILPRTREGQDVHPHTAAGASQRADGALQVLMWR